MGLLVLGICILILATCVHWVLAPLNRAAKHRQLPPQFRLADLFCLFVLVQLPVGGIHLWLDRWRAGFAVILSIDAMLTLSMALLWLACVRMLSQAGVHLVWRRCVVLTVVLPCTIASAIAVIWLLAAAIDFATSERWANGALMVLAEIPVIAVLYFLGRFMRATVAAVPATPQDREETWQNDPVFISLSSSTKRLILNVAIVVALLALLALAGCIALLALPVVAPLVCLIWVLGPLDRAAKNRQFPIQFGLADLLCLFVLIQLPIGILHWTLADDLKQGIVPADIVVGIAAGSVWWVCWHTMSRAGIQVVWQRCVVLALVLPGGYVGSIALAVLPFVAVAMFMSDRSTIAWWLLFVEITLPPILYYFGRFTRAIVAASKDNDVATETITLPDDDEAPTVAEEQ